MSPASDHDCMNWLGSPSCVAASDCRRVHNVPFSIPFCKSALDVHCVNQSSNHYYVKRLRISNFWTGFRSPLCEPALIGVLFPACDDVCVNELGSPLYKPSLDL